MPYKSKFAFKKVRMWINVAIINESKNSKDNSPKSSETE